MKGNLLIISNTATAILILMILLATLIDTRALGKTLFFVVTTIIGIGFVIGYLFSLFTKDKEHENAK
jgi:hypothetical protein